MEDCHKVAGVDPDFLNGGEVYSMSRGRTAGGGWDK